MHCLGDHNWCATFTRCLHYFIFKQVGNVFSEIWPQRWLALEGDPTLFINENDMRYASYCVCFQCIRSTLLVMLNFIPPVSLHMVYNGFAFFVKADSKDLDLTTPYTFLFCQYFLSSSQGFLTRRTPGGPKVNQPDFSRNMF